MAPKKPKNKRKNKELPEEETHDASAAPSKVESRAQPEAPPRSEFSIEPITPSIDEKLQEAPFLEAMRMIVSCQVCLVLKQLSMNQHLHQSKHLLHKGCDF